MLKLDGVTKKFGGLVAVNGVDLNIYKGEILGLVGPNGAGKTTLLNLISGIYRLTRDLSSTVARTFHDSRWTGSAGKVSQRRSSTPYPSRVSLPGKAL